MSQVTDVPVPTIEKLAERLGTTAPATICAGYGMQRYTNSGQAMRAIIALLAAKFYGANWLDPFMGIVGAALVSRWSYGLIRDSARVLLDRQADEAVMAAIRESLEGDSGDRITDLHCWSIGPGIYAADLAIVSDNPQSPDDYRSRIPVKLGVVHATIEVHGK